MNGKGDKLTEQRHVSAKGLEDNRGLPKKGGAGGHNWGNIKDEVEAGTEDKDKNGGTSAQKIRVIDSEEFSKLHP